MRPRRLVRSLPAGLLAVALLAACGDETSDGSSTSDNATDSAPTLSSRTLAGDPLDLTEAGTALLAPANAPGFENLGPATPDPDAVIDDGKTGCESEVSFEDRFDRAHIASTRADTAYLYGDESRLLIVTSLVTSFANEALAETAFNEVQADFQSCTHYEDTSTTGESTVVDVENNTDAASDDVDGQLNLLGKGLWSGINFEDVEMGFGLSLARLGNNITLTQVISIGVADDRLLLAPYTAIAVDRLLAVMNDETPQDVAGPMPTAPPTSRLPMSSNASTYKTYFKLDPRFALPD